MNTKKEATAVDSKKHFPLLGIVIFTLIIMMIWVCWMMTCDNEQKFQGTGVIGDTIGGLTSPIIGLLGAVLVYISFREQLNANKIQIEALKIERKQNRFERYLELKKERFKQITSSLESMSLEYPINDKRTDEIKTPEIWVNDMLGDNNIKLFNYKRGLLFISTKLIYHDNISLNASYEIVTFCTEYQNYLKAIIVEINFLQTNPSNKKANKLLLEIYHDYVVNSILPLLNPWVKDRVNDINHQKTKLPERLSNTLKRIVEYHGILKKFADLDKISSDI